MTATVNLWRLSLRQWQCVSLATDGHGNQEIADLLGIGVETVKSHMRLAMARMGVADRRALVVTAELSVRRTYNFRRITEYRDAAGMSRRDLAQRLYRSIGSIDDYQCGRTTPTADTLAGLADVLGRSVDDFFDVTPVRG